MRDTSARGNRREFLKQSATLGAVATGLGSSALWGKPREAKKDRPYKRIGTEEHFLLPVYTSAVAKHMKANPDAEPSEPWLRRGFPPVDKMPTGKRIQEFSIRVSEMDRDGVDHQVLSLCQPGVQVLGPKAGLEISRAVNDQITEICAKYPGRFSNLATIPPQAPKAAATELERAVKKLGMKGAVLNSHTKGTYIDDKSLWPIYEAAESLGVPIYLHPRAPSPQMIEPYQTHGLHMIWGFGAEASLNALRLILSGAFDVFPKLQFVLGHLGEGIPLYLDRIDNRYAYMPSKYKNAERPLKRKPSEYFRSNFAVTSSGQNWAPAVRFCQEVVGVDRVLFGADYPFENQAEAVKQGDEIPMSDEDRKKFFQLNAERLFKLAKKE